MTFHQQFISVMHVGYLSWKLRLLSLLLSSFFFLTYSLSLYMYTYVSEHIYLQYSQFDTLFLSLCVWCSGPLRHRNSRQKVRNKQIEREKWGKRIERQSFIQMSPFSNPPTPPPPQAAVMAGRGITQTAAHTVNAIFHLTGGHCHVLTQACPAVALNASVWIIKHY